MKQTCPKLSMNNIITNLSQRKKNYYLRLVSYLNLSLILFHNMFNCLIIKIFAWSKRTILTFPKHCIKRILWKYDAGKLPVTVKISFLELNNFQTYTCSSVVLTNLISRNWYEAQQRSKEQTKLPRFMLEGP